MEGLTWKSIQKNYAKDYLHCTTLERPETCLCMYCVDLLMHKQTLIIFVELVTNSVSQKFLQK